MNKQLHRIADKLNQLVDKHPGKYGILLLVFLLLILGKTGNSDFERLSSEPKTFREIVAEYDAAQAELHRRGK